MAKQNPWTTGKEQENLQKQQSTENRLPLEEPWGSAVPRLKNNGLHY